MEDSLAEEILNMNIKTGDILVAALDKENEKVVFEVKGSSVTEEKKEEEEEKEKKEEKPTES